MCRAATNASRKATTWSFCFDNPDADWRSAGDEPYMMSRVLNQYKVPIVIGKDRAAAATRPCAALKAKLFYWTTACSTTA